MKRNATFQHLWHSCIIFFLRETISPISPPFLCSLKQCTQMLVCDFAAFLLSFVTSKGISHWGTKAEKQEKEEKDENRSPEFMPKFSGRQWRRKKAPPKKKLYAFLLSFPKRSFCLGFDTIFRPQGYIKTCSLQGSVILSAR